MQWEWEEAHANGPVVGNGSTVRLADIIIIYGTYVYFCFTIAILRGFTNRLVLLERINVMSLRRPPLFHQEPMKLQLRVQP
jgi:hypothetical protein